MITTKMHSDEIDIDSELVRRLIDTQFPEWTRLAIEKVNSAGTDNAIFRLGNDLAIRLPRRPSAAEHIDKEYQWLPRLSAQLPLAVPLPVGKRGMPCDDYPWPWFVYRWLEGGNPHFKNNEELTQAAFDLGNFVAALQKIDTQGAPLCERGMPLMLRDAETLQALALLQGIIDTQAAQAAWQDALNAPLWNGPARWIHGDLQPGNLLAKDGKISGVIDFALGGIGDPACDMMVAWTLLSSKTRNIFREIVQVDDATWARGRGWALTFGLVALPYYQHTNKELAQIARKTIDSVLADPMS